MRNKYAKVSDPNSFITCPGSPENILYEAKVKFDGSIDVVPCGKENIQDKIESFRDQTDMSYIIKQLQLGNAQVLSATPGEFGDFTKAPKNMAEALQIQIDAEKAWYNLPVDIRAKFDHDFNRWLVAAGSDEWNAKMFPSATNEPGEAPVASEEVKE